MYFERVGSKDKRKITGVHPETYEKCHSARGWGFHGSNGTVFVQAARSRESDKITGFYAIYMTLLQVYYSFRESPNSAPGKIPESLTSLNPD